MLALDDHALPRDTAERIRQAALDREVAASVRRVGASEPLRILVARGVADDVEDEALELVRC